MILSVEVTRNIKPSYNSPLLFFIFLPSIIKRLTTLSLSKLKWLEGGEINISRL